MAYIVSKKEAERAVEALGLKESINARFAFGHGYIPKFARERQSDAIAYIAAGKLRKDVRNILDDMSGEERLAQIDRTIAVHTLIAYLDKHFPGKESDEYKRTVSNVVTMLREHFDKQAAGTSVREKFSEESNTVLLLELPCIEGASIMPSFEFRREIQGFGDFRFSSDIDHSSLKTCTTVYRLELEYPDLLKLQDGLMRPVARGSRNQQQR